MRFPPVTYREKIWDHCAGSIVVEEAGGKITDAAGGAWRSLNAGDLCSLSANLPVAGVREFLQLEHRGFLQLGCCLPTQGVPPLGGVLTGGRC